MPLHIVKAALRMWDLLVHLRTPGLQRCKKDIFTIFSVNDLLLLLFTGERRVKKAEERKGKDEGKKQKIAKKCGKGKRKELEKV